MIEIFKVRKALTMNPSWPEGTAIAVRDGRILEVGDMDAMSIWTRHDEHRVNDDFADKVVMPGLIDPHLHPLMAAVLLPMQFITAMEWRLPFGHVPACRSPEDYLRTLKQHAAKVEPDMPFFSWGYHKHWHGEMNRGLLDEIFGDHPAVVWQRSFHEVYLNSAMLEHCGIDAASLAGKHQIDIDRGHFYEAGLSYAINKLNPIIMSPEWIDEGLNRLKQIVHYGGHTSLGDMAVGLFDLELEWAASRRMLDHDDSPFRVICVPHALLIGAPPGDYDAMIEKIEALKSRNTHRFQFTNKVKLFTDGAFFSQLAMLKEPGYTDDIWVNGLFHQNIMRA